MSEDQVNPPELQENKGDDSVPQEDDFGKNEENKEDNNEEKKEEDKKEDQNNDEDKDTNYDRQLNKDVKTTEFPGNNEEDGKENNKDQNEKDDKNQNEQKQSQPETKLDDKNKEKQSQPNEQQSESSSSIIKLKKSDEPKVEFKSELNKDKIQEEIKKLEDDNKILMNWANQLSQLQQKYETKEEAFTAIDKNQTELIEQEEFNNEVSNLENKEDIFKKGNKSGKSGLDADDWTYLWQEFLLDLDYNNHRIKILSNSFDYIASFETPTEEVGLEGFSGFRRSQKYEKVFNRFYTKIIDELRSIDRIFQLDRNGSHKSISSL